MGPLHNDCIDSGSAYAILLSKPARGSTDESRLFRQSLAAANDRVRDSARLLKRSSAAVATRREGHLCHDAPCPLRRDKLRLSARS
jgi:hypothetical protein